MCIPGKPVRLSSSSSWLTEGSFSDLRSLCITGLESDLTVWSTDLDTTDEAAFKMVDFDGTGVIVSDSSCSVSSSPSSISIASTPESLAGGSSSLSCAPAGKNKKTLFRQKNYTAIENEGIFENDRLIVENMVFTFVRVFTL